MIANTIYEGTFIEITTYQWIDYYTGNYGK